MIKANKLKPNVYKLLERAIKDGLPGGYWKAHKHTDAPLIEEVFAQQLHYIMLEINEVFDFDDD